MADSTGGAHTGLRLVDVVRDYGKGTRIGPVSFSVARGEFVSLLGPSGCGKTTLLRCIAGFEPVDAGSVIVEDADIARLPPHRRGVGLVFQNYALFPHLTVAENVGFGLRLRKVATGERQRRVDDALRVVGLEALAGRYPAQLSGGQQQRVAIARALVLEPSILLLDEPLSNLDFKLRLQMRHELLQLQRRLKMTFVYVTHDQTEALAMSDRVIVLSGGRIEQQGTPADVYRWPRTRFVADFIGASNLLEVDRVEHAAGGLVAHLACGLRIGCTTVEGRVPSGRLWVSIRPEHAVLAPDGAGAGSVFARPVSTVFCGDKAEVAVELEVPGDAPGPRIVAHAPPLSVIPGRVAVQIDPGTAVLVGES